jgi:RNA polymerase sigma-B factor
LAAEAATRSDALTDQSTDRRDDLRHRFVELAATRDPAVRAQLVEAHLGLARHLARRFLNRGESYDDLFQVASMALVKAVDRFDPERGVAFATFATRTILGELKRHFRDKGWSIRAPRRIQELYVRLGSSIAQLSQDLGRSPTIAELAADADATEEEVLEALEAGQGYRATSLEAPVSGGDDESLSDRLGQDEPGYQGAERRAELSPLLEKLPQREQAILALRFVEGLTQSEIAKRIGVSQMHVSRMLSRSLAKLREGCAET